MRADACAFFFVSDVPLVFPVRLSTIAYFDPRFLTLCGMFLLSLVLSAGTPTTQFTIQVRRLAPADSRLSNPLSRSNQLCLRVNEAVQIIGLRRLIPTNIRKSPQSRSRSDWRYQRCALFLKRAKRKPRRVARGLCLSSLAAVSGAAAGTPPFMETRHSVAVRVHPP